MMSRQTRHGMVGALLALFSCAVLSDEIRNYYEEPGITPFKSATENLNETINLFSGALQIRHVDLTLPGNGGLDIQVTRYYNHHSNVRRYPNYMSVYGVGWTMHLGRIVKPAGTGLCPTGGTTNFNPSLELADGSRHLLVLDTDGSGDYITHGNWRARCETSAGGLPYLLVISPEGTRYTMDQYMGITLGEVTEASWFTSKIEDIHGNTINITYQADGLGYQYLNTITSSDGRLVEFVYDTDPNGCFKLRQMQTDGRIWMYAYEPVSGINPTDSGICGYNLTQVTLPDGRTWNYTYYPPSTSPGAYSLKSITYPYGGTVTYTYDEVVFSDVIGIPFSTTPLPDPTTVVASKTTAGPAIAPGTWTYQYEPKSVPANVNPVLTGCGYVFDTSYRDKTTVITPTAVDVYHHNSNYAVEVHAETAICYFYLRNFQVGLLSERLTYALSALDDGDLSNDTPIEKITQAWEPRQISEQPYWHGGPSWRIESDGTFVPQLTARRIWRDDPTFENPLGTDYADYDHYGNAGTMIEYAGFGDSRTTRRSYFNDPNLWIIGRVATETVENVELCSISDSACFDPPQDMTITRSHDPRNGDLLSEDRYGVLTTYTYHPSGDLHTRTDAKGNITTYTNYHRGIAQHETFEDQTDGDASRTITRVVNPAGTVASLTNGRGYTVGFSYDALNRVTGIDYPLNADVTIDWSDLALAGRRLTRQDPVQAEFVYQQVDYFDGFGRTVQTDRMGGQETITVSRQYDALGQAIFISYPNSANGTTSQFDALGRLIETRHPDGTFRQYQYAFADRIVSETDERSQTHTRYYRAFGSPGNDQVQIQLDQPVDGNNAQIINTLTFYNHLNQLTLGLQGEISGDTVYGYPRYYTYDDRGFLEKEQQPEFGTRYYTHDAVGNLKTVETINGTVGSGLTVYDYDGLNRLTHIDYPSDTPDVRRTYDANDNLTDTEKGDTHWHYEYDANDNLLQETLNLAQNSGTTRAYSLQYRYNPLDALADITYPDGTIIGYNPDPLGRATEVTDFASQVEFHPNGHLKTARLVNGQTLDIALNTRLFPEHLNVVNFAGTQIDLAYSYDGVGNVTRILDGIQSSRSVDSLKYDGMNRLTEANGSWGGGHFGYDAASNLISQTLGGQALTYHYNGMWLSALSGTVDRTYTYDIFGNIKNNGSQTLLYDGASQLTEVIDPTTGTGTHTTYQYDGHGQRTIETDALTGNRRYTLYNRAGQLLYEQDLTTCRYTDYIRLGGLLLARQDRIDDESDSDHDGLSDCQEDIYGLNPYEPDGTNDTDQDGLTDAQEIALGTDLANPDSDGDGVLDGAEVTAGTDPLSPRLWSTAVNGIVFGEPAVATDGTIYVGTVAGTLYAFNPDGSVRWTYTTIAGGIYSAPTVDSNGTVYIHDSYYLYALNANGSLRWQTLALDSGRDSPALASDGTLYMGWQVSSAPDAYSLYTFKAFNPNGTERWTFKGVDGWVTSAAIGSEGTIYVASNAAGLIDASAYLYAISAEGQFQWRFALGATDVQSSPAIGADGTIYIGAYDRRLYAINPDGSLRWSYLTGAAINSSPVLSADGTVYVGSRDGYLYALNPNGSLKWRTFVFSTIDGAPAIGADGTIYVGSGDDQLYALAPENGAIRWHFATGADVDAAPVIGPDGTVYIGSFDQSVYAFTGAPGDTTDSIWPMFQRDAQHRGGTGETVLPPDGDSDGDGMSNSFEQQHGLDPLDPSDASQDADNDGFTNLQESQAGTDPNDPDSDDDGLSDGDEILTFHTNPLLADSDGDTLSDCRELYHLGTLPTEADTDRDGLQDGVEATQSLNPLDALHDADGDTYNDAQEVLSGTDPHNAASHPLDGQLAWAKSLGSAGIPSPLALGKNSTVYAQADGEALWALNPDGTVQWSYPANNSGSQAPTVDADNRILIVQEDSSLSALDPDSTLLWRYLVTQSTIGTSLALAANGTGYFGQTSGTIIALSADGSLEWSYQTEGPINSSAAVAVDGTVYLGSQDRSLYALYPWGALKWRYTTDGEIHAAPAIGADGTIYVGATDSYLYAIDADGQLRWRYAAGGEIHASPAIGPDGTVYIGANDQDFYALNADGTLKWRAVGMGSSVSPALAADGTVYVGAGNDLYAFHQDGTLKWQFQTQGEIRSSPMVGDNGFIYIGSEDAKVYALVDANGGPAAGPWPMFQRNAQHTGLQTIELTLGIPQALAAKATPRALVHLKDQTAADLWFSRDGTDLLIQPRHTDGALRLSGWFAVEVQNRLYLEDQEGARLAPQAVDRLLEVMHDDSGYTQEPWRAIAGNKVSDLFRASSYRQDDPEQVTVLRQALQLPTADAPNTGYRLSGYLEAPVSGAYTFSLPTASGLSEDSVAFYLSESENPVSLRAVSLASETNQTGQPVTLQAGQRYYFELYRKVGAEISASATAIPVYWQRSGAMSEAIPLDALHLHSQPREQHALSPTVKAVMADAWSGLSQRDLEGQP